MIKKEKSKDKVFFSEEIYKSISMNNLIILGIYLVLKKGENCTFEKLVAECFILFPKVFSFERFPKWPDSLRFDRPLRTLREEGLIVGNPKTLFSLTKFGISVARKTEMEFKTGVIRRKFTGKIGRDPEINWIYELKKSNLFERFLTEGKKFLLSNMELRNLLHCTLETPSRIVKQNLAYSIKLAKELREEKLIQFLELCKKKLNR